jgi:DNA-binding XRE family transcriptional regulator
MRVKIVVVRESSSRIMPQKNLVEDWRKACGLSKAEAAEVLGMTAQRYHYCESHGKTLPREALRVMAACWSERTEREPAEFYKRYHDNA